MVEKLLYLFGGKLEFPHFYPQGSDLISIIIDNFQKMPKI